MIEPGTIIGDKYKILRIIGQGGMSIVYLALNERVNRYWAIKEIPKKYIYLVTEIEILKKLDHPNLPRIIDVIDAQDMFLIVMDYIDGMTLKELFEKEGPQSQEIVLNWASQICDGLQYLHERNPPIIYRDMKPSNIMLRSDGKIIIIDFGIAREYKVENHQDTICLGTCGYAAPEQYNQACQSDVRTDIYSFGVTIYYLLTGHNSSVPPYDLYPLRYWNENFSAGLEEILDKCTKKNPEERYQTCLELKFDLLHYKELDQEFHKVKKKQWHLFMLFVFASFLSLFECIYFYQKESNLRERQYQHYVKYANMVDSIEEKMKFYEQAIYLIPEKGEAYMEFLKNCLNNKEVDGSYGVYTQKEAEKMIYILENKNHESKFQNNTKEYCEFAYEMGLAYFFYYEKEGNPQMSKKWFEIVVRNNNITEHKIFRSKILLRIASYDSELKNRGNDKIGDSNVTYHDYWKDMNLLIIEKNFIEQDTPEIRWMIYKNVIHQLFNYTVDFKNAGVQKKELLSVIEQIEMNFHKMNINDKKDDDQLQTIEEDIKNTRAVIEITYENDHLENRRE